ncbi:YqhA family protein [Acidocella sp.]|uniref:YqhA family protein n=2 Tax=Acidocella sp. TaxID=50710 RepID=UPI00261B0DAE|nr:YqhA family protein [Acidocella sp.]
MLIRRAQPPQRFDPPGLCLYAKGGETAPMTPARLIEAVLYAGRWLIVPVYVAMLGLLGTLVWFFLVELWHSLPDIPGMTENGLIMLALTLIDLSLTANLVMLVILAGYENFVRRGDFGDDSRPGWLGKVDFAGLKLKLLGAITVIAAVDLLRSFLDIANQTDRDLLWQVVIVAVFGLLALLFALTDWIADLAHPPARE